MKRLSWVLILLVAAGCGGGSNEVGDTGGESPADAVASYSAGSIGFAEIEERYSEARTPACLAARRARGGGSIEELLPCYEEIAENLVLERLVLADIDDVARAATEIEQYGEMRRHAYLEVFNRRLAEEIEIDDGAVEAHYEANREQYRRPGSLSLWNIFRRHEDPANPEATLEYLRELKARYEAGETFAALARAHSHSETRLRDGQVGQVNEGQLPARLEEAAFALGDGDVSEPLLVQGGAVLLHVRSVTRGVDLTFQDVEARIRRQLGAEATVKRIEERVSAVQPPAGAVILEPDELVSALDGEDEEAAVLDVDGDRITVGEARRVAGLEQGSSAGELDEAGRERLLAVYEQRRSRALLAYDLAAAADSEFRTEAEEHLGDEAVAALVDDRLRGETETTTLVDSETLESYYRDNLPHYQSPLRFRLQILDVPFGSNPPGQLRRMEQHKSALEAGETQLAAVAADLGGAVRDLGWRELAGLTEVTGKAQQYLLQTEVGEGGGFSIPYQQEDALHMLWVQEREEPGPLSYEEAAEQVRADYLERFEEQLFRQMAERKLAEADFLFDDEAVRRALAN